MASHRLIRGAAAVLLGGAALGLSVVPRAGLSARQQAPPSESPSIRTTLPASSRATRARSRRVGHRGNGPAAHEVPQDRRHGRPTAVICFPTCRKPTYVLWVRGYGLVDSPRTAVTPGSRVALHAVVAPDARAAAQIYPANYWYSLIRVPRANAVPGHRSRRQRHRARYGDAAPLDQSDQDGLQRVPSARQSGDPRVSGGLGTFESSFDAWDRRTQVGQDGTSMIAAFGQLGRKTALHDVRGLDRSHRGGRGAARAATPGRHRAQSRADALGVGWARHLCPRRVVDRQAQPDGERQRADLRRRLGQRRVSHARPEYAYRHRVRIPVLDPDRAAGQTPGHAEAVAVLG